jgi:hypothetical protein
VVWMRVRRHVKLDDQMLILFGMFNPRVSSFNSSQLLETGYLRIEHSEQYQPLVIQFHMPSHSHLYHHLLSSSLSTSSKFFHLVSRIDT